jgi:predicted RNA-binding protein with RPS1 domain
MTNNKQQTAVEWLEQEMLKPNLSMKEILEQAKKMEKKQHKKTWLDSTSQFDNAAEMTFKKDFDDHYNETYGGCEQ